MKAFLYLFLLLSLPPVFSAAGDREEPTTEAVVNRIADDAPVIDLWRKTLANALQSVIDEDDDFPPHELQQMKDAIEEAVAALDKLYRARLLYGYTCIAEAYEAHVYYSKEAQKMRTEWRKLLDECAERDLQAVFLRVLWVESSNCPSPPSHDMRIEMPRYIRAFRNRSCGVNNQVCLRASRARSSMEEMVEAFSEIVLHTYDGDCDDMESDRESVTGYPIEGMIGTDTTGLCTKLQKLYAESENCWRNYCSKVEALVSPCHSCSGSGTSELMDDLVCHLLNSRDIYLARIVTGILDNPFWLWETDDPE